ncbi:MAG: DUF2177 family protein [Alphaproteobacteria bacterium]
MDDIMDMALKYGAIYVAALLTFLILDGVWLGVVARGFYVNQLGDLMRPSPNWGVAGLFYLLYIVGVVVFAILPGLGHSSWFAAAGLGALFGLMCYGTYDLTNLATLRGWPPLMSIVDMVWGTALTGIVALSGYLAARHFLV